MNCIAPKDAEVRYGAFIIRIDLNHQKDWL